MSEQEIHGARGTILWFSMTRVGATPFHTCTTHRTGKDIGERKFPIPASSPICLLLREWMKMPTLIAVLDTNELLMDYWSNWKFASN